MSTRDSIASGNSNSSVPSRLRQAWEIGLLVMLFFVAAGEAPPAVNEAHYLIKAKSFWNPNWLANDLFVSSPKEHIAFYSTIGYLTQYFSLETTAWIGRILGWTLLAAGLQHCVNGMLPIRYASLAIAAVWIVAVSHANLAGEWVVGGIEAKVIAYGLVLVALGEIFRDRWSSAWIVLGLASAFHVLVGGWSVVAALVVRVSCGTRGSLPVESNRKYPFFFTIREVSFLVLGGTISLIGLLPGLALNSDATATQARIAAQIYAYGRLTHHLSPGSFPTHWFVRHGVLIGASAIAYRHLFQYVPTDLQRPWKQFRWFWIATLTMGLTGLLIGLLPAFAPALAASLLRFYWFRMTDAFTALAAAAMVAGLLAYGRPNARVLAGGVLVLCSLVLTNHVFEFGSSERSPAQPRSVISRREIMIEAAEASIQSEWQRVCYWIRDNTDRQAQLLTPRHQQTFKWYAERAEVVNWKDIPQDAISLIEWATRINRVFPRELNRRHSPLDRHSLTKLATDFQAQFILVDHRVVQQKLPLDRVYPLSSDEVSTFSVYRLPILSDVSNTSNPKIVTAPES